jgi:hypothetical protein
MELLWGSNAEPINLQHQFPGMDGQTKPSLGLDAVEQLTHRDRLDFTEVQFSERAGDRPGLRSTRARASRRRASSNVTSRP